MNINIVSAQHKFFAKSVTSIITDDDTFHKKYSILLRSEHYVIQVVFQSTTNRNKKLKLLLAKIADVIKNNVAFTNEVLIDYDEVTKSKKGDNS